MQFQNHLSRGWGQGLKAASKPWPAVRGGVLKLQQGPRRGWGWRLWGYAKRATLTRPWIQMQLPLPKPEKVPEAADSFHPGAVLASERWQFSQGCEQAQALLHTLLGLKQLGLSQGRTGVFSGRNGKMSISHTVSLKFLKYLLEILRKDDMEKSAIRPFLRTETDYITGGRRSQT